jgi:hypothetical protein
MHSHIFNILRKVLNKYWTRSAVSSSPDGAATKIRLVSLPLFVTLLLKMAEEEEQEGQDPTKKLGVYEGGRDEVTGGCFSIYHSMTSLSFSLRFLLRLFLRLLALLQSATDWGRTSFQMGTFIPAHISKALVKEKGSISGKNRLPNIAAATTARRKRGAAL